MQKLNHQPRKILIYKTTHAVFFGDDNLQAT
jgi:IS30 family transposase